MFPCITRNDVLTDVKGCGLLYPPVVTKRPLKVHRHVQSTRNCARIVPMTCPCDQYHHWSKCRNYFLLTLAKFVKNVIFLRVLPYFNFCNFCCSGPRTFKYGRYVSNHIVKKSEKFCLDCIITNGVMNFSVYD